MDIDEAKKVVEIILECDGGCKYCVANLLKLFNDEFPDYKDIVNMLFRDKFGIELEDFLNELYKEYKR